MIDDPDDPIRKLETLNERIKAVGIQEAMNFDPNNPTDLAHFGAGEANLLLLQILLELRGGSSPEGMLATKIKRAAIEFDQVRFSSWLEGFCDQLQKVLEAGMEGKDVDKALTTNIRI